MITGHDIVAEARTWIGTPWQHQARLKGVATDCIGLVGGVALNLKLPGAREWRDDVQFHNYSRQPNPTVLVGGCETLLEPGDRLNLRLGDILVLRFFREPQHFAIVSQLDPPYMIHALARAPRHGRVVENRIDEQWRARIVRVYRFRGVQ